MRVWEDSRSAEEAAVRLAMKEDTARHRARKLRKAGFALSTKRADADERKLKALAEAVVHGDCLGLSPREFLLLYLAGAKIHTICRLAGIDPGHLFQKLRHWRRAGVPIPRRNCA
jgi:hypothetical protein